jgi:hypothetical protein
LEAIEKAVDLRSASRHWQAHFRSGAQTIGVMDGQDVLWHESSGIWGVFAKTQGRRGSERPWNAFGQKPYQFRSNMIVEINPPAQGADQNLQGAFARDTNGCRWVMHQGRMSVPGRRVTEDDFISATGALQDARPIGWHIAFAAGRCSVSYLILSVGRGRYRFMRALVSSQALFEERVKLELRSEKLNLCQAWSPVSGATIH